LKRFDIKFRFSRVESAKKDTQHDGGQVRPFSGWRQVVFGACRKLAVFGVKDYDFCCRFQQLSFHGPNIHTWPNYEAQGTFF
jgi:hypothetical protein